MSVKVSKDSGVATVLLDRPDKLNALSAEMYHDLARHFAELNADDEVRSVVLTGAGRAFCAGGDVGSMGNYDVVAGRQRSKSHQQMFQSLYVPTLEMLLEMETLAVGNARLTHDHAEGVAAFKEKHAPKFKGR